MYILVIYKFQLLQLVVVLQPPAMIVTLRK